MERTLLPLIGLFGVLALVNFYFSFKVAALKRQLYHKLNLEKPHPPLISQGGLSLSFRVFDQKVFGQYDTSANSLLATPGAMWPSFLKPLPTHETIISRINNGLKVVRLCRACAVFLFVAIIVFVVIKTT